jgi:hypothetical protein
MTDVSWQEVGRTALGKVAADGTALLVLVLGAVGAAAGHSWLVASAAVALYTGVVGIKVSRPGFWRAVVKEMRRRPPPLPGDVELKDPDAVALCGRIRAARTAREPLLAHDGGPRPDLYPVLEDLCEVERQAALLLLTLDRIGRHLQQERAGDGGPADRAAEGTLAAQMVARRAGALGRLALLRDRLVEHLEATARAVEALPSCLAELEAERLARAGGILDDDRLRSLIAGLDAIAPPLDPDDVARLEAGAAS